MIQDPSILHAVAFHHHHEHIFLAADQIQRDRVGVFDVFHCQDGISCMDSTY